MRLFDLRHAARLVRSSPCLAGVIVLLLAGGITVTTAAFAVVNTVWLRPLPYPDADRLVFVSELHPRLGPASSVSPATYDVWRESPGWAEAVGAFTERAPVLGRPGLRAERARGVSVAPDLLRLLGAQPLHGRTLTRDDARPGAGPVAVISERFWRQRCSADLAIVGSTVRLDGVETTIVGVLPYSFKVFNSGFEVFTPLPQAASADDSRSLLVVARLPRGTSLEQSATQLATQAGAAPPRPGREAGWTPVLRPLAAVMWGEARPAYLLLLTATLLLLALIVANVSNLLLARSETRRHEFALRLTLGAGRSGIVWQLLSEGVALAAASGAAAFVACVWLRHLLVARFPEMADLKVDASVFAFVLVVSAVVGLAFGLLPAWSVLRSDVGGTLREQVGSNARRRASGRVLAVLQLSAAAALLMCCGLLVRAAFGIRDIEPGFETERLLTASVSLPSSRYPSDDTRVRFYRELTRQVASIPGTASVGLVSRLPLHEGVGALRIEVEGRPTAGDDALRASRKTIDEGYLRALGVRLIAGEDNRDPAAVLINEALVAALWKGDVRAAVGSRLRIDGGSWYRVAGVVSDARQVLTLPASPEIYSPLAAGAPDAMSLVIRTASDPVALGPRVAAAVEGIDPDVPASNIWTMETIVDGYFPAPFAAAFGGLAVLALLLSAIGLYAVIAFQVSRRTREFGIRIALGANAARLRRDVVSDGLRLTAFGLVPGVVVGSGIGFVLLRELEGVGVAVDPLVVTIVCAVLVVVSAAACLVPGGRATRIEPAVALRYE